MINRTVLISLCLLLVFPPPYLAAKEVGRYGNAMEFKERSMADVIKEKAANFNTEEWADKMGKLIKNQINGFNGFDFPHTEKGETKYITPTYTLPRDMLDYKGNVMFKAGEVINPLDFEHMRLHSKYLVIDGKSDKQLNYAVDLSKKEASLMVMITRGGILDIAEDKELRTYVLLDSIVSLFQIEVTPSLISQEGNRIKVEEVFLK